MSMKYVFFLRSFFFLVLTMVFAKASLAAGVGFQQEMAAQADSTPHAADGGQVAASGSDAAAAQAPAPAAALFKPGDGFFTRWGKAYVADWTGTAPSDPNAPKRRGTPGPISSPPFPAADWPIGATQEIGAPDYQSYMLQQAIDKDPLKLNRVKWYGWIAIGGNGSTNNRSNASKGIAANLPSAYDEFSNTIVLDQIALYTERLADTTQTDHFDWGFRIASLYGQDYRFTTSHGILSQQLLVKNAQYGYDPVMFYVDLYFPASWEAAPDRAGWAVYLGCRISRRNWLRTTTAIRTRSCTRMTATRRWARI